MAELTTSSKTYTGSPGIFVNEVDMSEIAPQSAATRTTKIYCLLGVAQRGTPDNPTLVTNQRDFRDKFGMPIDEAGFAAYKILAYTSPVIFTRITNGKEEARFVDLPGYSIGGITDNPETPEDPGDGPTFIESALNIEITTPGTYFSDEIKAYVTKSKLETRILDYTYKVTMNTGGGVGGGKGYAVGEQLVVPVQGPDGTVIEAIVEVTAVNDGTEEGTTAGEIEGVKLVSPTNGVGTITQENVAPTSGSVAGTGARFDFSSEVNTSVNYNSFYLTIEQSAEYSSVIIEGWFTTDPEGGTRKDKDTKNKEVELTYIDGYIEGDFAFALGVDSEGQRAGIILDTADEGANFSTGSNGAEVISTNFSEAIELLSDPEQYDYDVIAAPPYAGTFTGEGAVNISDLLNEVPTERKDVVALLDPPRGATPQEIVDYFLGLGIDSSYVASYAPHVYMQGLNGTIELYSPSVALLIGMAKEYSAYDLWIAPAGRPRMELDFVLGTEFKYKKADRDLLYDNGVNPICNYKNLGMTAFGQKTMYSKNSALNRLGVRFLVNYIKKAVEDISAHYLFNGITTLLMELWNQEVAGVLDPIKRRDGMYDYKTTMDETTVTSEMVNNNTMPGLIQIKPTRAAEYIPIDIVIRNRDDEFE